MFLAKLSSQILSLIIIVYDNSFFFPLFNIYIDIEDGNLQIIFTHFVFSRFLVCILQLRIPFLYSFAYCLDSLLQITKILFILFRILTISALNLFLNFCIIAPSFLEDNFFLFFQLTSFFHPYKHFIYIFDIDYFLFAITLVRIYFRMKCKLVLFSFKVNIILLSLFKVHFGSWQMFNFFFKLSLLIECDGLFLFWFGGFFWSLIMLISLSKRQEIQ